jgi:hypothetical protein
MSRGRVCVLYGSQTGTAQDLAERFVRAATRRHFTVPPGVPMDAFPAADLPSQASRLCDMGVGGRGVEWSAGVLLSAMRRIPPPGARRRRW